MELCANRRWWKLAIFWAKSLLTGRIPYEEIKLRNEPFNAMVELEDFKRMFSDLERLVLLTG